MPIEKNEIDLVIEKILPIIDDVIAEYDFRKYPSAEYENHKSSFSTLSESHINIAGAMKWKWGHWGKPNFPAAHKNLIVKIERLWPKFIASDCVQNSNLTYMWWSKNLNKKTTYITVAYITHLIHYDEPLPIIDQHNFRAMNELLGSIKPSRKSKKKPSNWDDIMTLKSFMECLKEKLPSKSFSDIDRFLMMYGKNHAAR